MSLERPALLSERHCNRARWDGTFASRRRPCRRRPMAIVDYGAARHDLPRRCLTFVVPLLHTCSGASSAAPPAGSNTTTAAVDTERRPAVASPAVATDPAPVDNTAAPARAKRKVIEKLATYEFSIEGVSPEVVAEKIADPKTWVTLMGMPEETVPELLGLGSDFKCVRDDGKTCYMTSIISKDGDREGVRAFSYTTSLTHTHLGDAGLVAPIFSVKHEFTMSSSSAGCVVQRVCTDFEQNEMLQVDLGAMLQGGMIVKENTTLARLCKAVVQRTVLINGDEVPLTAEQGIDLEKVMNWGTFTKWVTGIDAKFLIEKVHIQSVDMFGPNIGFVKFRADCFDRATHTFLPGTVFMRGGSVGILTIIIAEETGEEFTIAVAQPRLPMGSFESLEIPAGMLDGSGNFAGKAASEMEEETGIIVKDADLVDLTEMVQGARHNGIWLSPGGSDEFMRLFVYRKRWPRADIEALEGKLTGLRESGELITLRIIPYADLIRAPDGKTLSSIGLYERVKDELPSPGSKEAEP
eukprot:COSAG02_NODE_410_length_22875_cov_43.282755_14_plen_524_part_00